jgi:alanine racemase
MANYRVIQELVPNQFILPMLKADAYGHGAVWVAQSLAGFPQLYGFGVATLQEGADLRIELGPRIRKTPVVVFSECTPWTEEKGQFCEQYDLRPVITSEYDWIQFFKNKWMDRISYEIQFNTGMNRLGISPSYLPTLIKNLKTIAPEKQPAGILSHLAIAEEPDAKLSLAQMDRFRSIRSELSGVLPGSTRFHIANSAAIWNSKNFGIRDLTEVVRPGLSLYGVPPWSGASEKGIAPVMTVLATIIAIHKLRPGDCIGDGATYRVSGSDPVYAAILAAGYADGVMRSWSKEGRGWLEGKETRFLGNIGMDLCAVQCSSTTSVGNWVELIGPHIDPWAQARAAGTIPYELLTSLSPRVKRMYDTKS